MTATIAATVTEGSSISVTGITDDGTSVATNNAGIRYQWQISTDGGATFATAPGTATGSSYQTSAGMEGDQLRVVVTDTETSGTFVTTDTFTTTPAVTVQELTNDMTATIAATVTEGSSISVTGITDDGTSVATNNAGIRYQWQISTDGGATFATAPGTATGSSYQTSAGMEGDQLRVVVTDTETSGTFVTTDTFTTTPAVTVQELTNDMTATIAATVTEGSSISVTGITDDGTSVATNNAGIRYQWQISTDGGATFATAPGTATGSSYQTSAGMEGDQLRVVVTDTETSGTFVTTDTFTTTPAVTVQELTNDMTATIAATVTEGSSISVTGITDDGTSVATNDAGIRYQWQISTDGGATYATAPGTATGSSYQTSAGMEGDQLRVVVTDTETSGTFVT